MIHMAEIILRAEHCHLLKKIFLWNTNHLYNSLHSWLTHNKSSLILPLSIVSVFVGWVQSYTNHIYSLEVVYVFVYESLSQKAKKKKCCECICTFFFYWRSQAFLDCDILNTQLNEIPPVDLLYYVWSVTWCLLSFCHLLSMSVGFFFRWSGYSSRWWRGGSRGITSQPHPFPNQAPPTAVRPRTTYSIMMPSGAVCGTLWVHRYSILHLNKNITSS